MCMKWISAYCTDNGIRKSNNQDSLLIQQAQTPCGEIMLAMICDGMGGLKKGEIASAYVIRAFRTWFQERIPEICLADSPFDLVQSEWSGLLQELHFQLKDAAEKAGFRVGTTVEALLLIENSYCICHIGDCRVYSLGSALEQITKDQSFVQQEIDAGRMTPEEAEADERRCLLLQCVGAGKTMQPVFLAGDISAGKTFLLCCDGFRHKISCSEIEDALRAAKMGREKSMQRVLEKLTQRCKQRKETDNITSILLSMEQSRQPLWALLPELHPAKEKRTAFKMLKDVMVIHTEESLDDLQKSK